MTLKNSLKTQFLPGLGSIPGWVFLGLSIGLAFSLSGCSGVTQQPDAMSVNNAPKWVLGEVDEGTVCSEDKGVYPRSEAYLMAINHCLIQLADKQISGESHQSKLVEVQTTLTGESVKTLGKSHNQFKVTTVQGALSLQYEVLGKYYNPSVEKVYVWIKLTP